ncbi:TetR/AcrR family transcriptional regulator [Paenibacillus sp. S150]|uniref:TetR/AcrR family transcriptional regulator n=1 Tax=Paenibacillus sp. S150 TaxID=2749826 RepID=UPI001C5975A2|nr:TetR/AcrR family transcriptional regulator [Paenibacillus sp. S150]MBW4081166.1 TetR/AcrR family transcriptional regulator [Paenibacillus sp. S150]
MKRAMTESAKAEKAKMILDVAREMYQYGKYEDIKMSDIAKAAKVSNGTLFYYYSTKEILFMEMLFLEYEERFKNFMNILRPLDKMSYEEFKAFFLGEMEGILEQDSVFIRLSAIKNTILEKNIDEETAVKAAAAMYASVEPIVRFLTERVSFLDTESFINLMGAQNAIIVGYVNIASMPDVMFKAIAGQNLQSFKIDFKRSALTAMEYYLDGLYRSQNGA